MALLTPHLNRAPCTRVQRPPTLTEVGTLYDPQCPSASALVMSAASTMPGSCTNGMREEGEGGGGHVVELCPAQLEGSFNHTCQPRPGGDGKRGSGTHCVVSSRYPMAHNHVHAYCIARWQHWYAKPPALHCKNEMAGRTHRQHHNANPTHLLHHPQQAWCQLLPWRKAFEVHNHVLVVVCAAVLVSEHAKRRVWCSDLTCAWAGSMACAWS